jgi:hypothetical protein
MAHHMHRNHHNHNHTHFLKRPHQLNAHHLASLLLPLPTPCCTPTMKCAVLHRVHPPTWMQLDSKRHPLTLVSHAVPHMSTPIAAIGAPTQHTAIHTHSLTLIHSHSFTHTHSLPLIHSHTFIHAHSLTHIFHSHSFTPTHSLAHIHSHSFTHTHISLTHIHSHSFTITLTLTHTHLLTLTSLTLMHPHLFCHSLTHIHSHFHSSLARTFVSHSTRRNSHTFAPHSPTPRSLITEDHAARQTAPRLHRRGWMRRVQHHQLHQPFPRRESLLWQEAHAGISHL